MRRVKASREQVQREAAELVRASVKSYRFLIIPNANFIPRCSWVSRGISSAVSPRDVGLPDSRLTESVKVGSSAEAIDRSPESRNR